MARLFVRLKLSLIAGGLRGTGGTARVVGLIFALVGGLIVMPAGFAVLAFQHGKPGAVNVAVVAFTVFAAGWLAFPVMMFGADETLDPTRLALLPIRPAALAWGLLAAGLTGVGPVLTFVILLGAVVALASGLWSALIGIAAVAIALGLCVTGSRALVTALSGVLRTRRGRDLGVLLGGLVVLAVFGANMAFQRSLGAAERGTPGSIGAGLGGAASVARWTPPGMAAHAVADAAAGRYGEAVAELGLAALVVLALTWAWIAALRRALERPDASTQTGRRAPRAAAGVARAGVAGVTRAADVAGMAGAADVAGVTGAADVAGVAGAGVAGRAPAGVAGAGVAGSLAVRPRAVRPHWPQAGRALTAAGKELRYYRRDPRRKQQLVSLVMPVLIILADSRVTAAGAAGSGVAAARLAVWPAVFGGMIAGMFSSANQWGMDGSAFWLTVSATSRWQDLRADIAGKNIAGAVLTLPVFALLYLMLGVLTGDGAGAAAAFAMAACALGTTAFVGSVTSVLLPIAIPERRSSAFSSGGAGQGCLAGVTTTAGLAVTAILMVPVFAARAAWGSGPWLLAVAPAFGLAMALLGQRIAAGIGFARLPELLAKVSSLI